MQVICWVTPVNESFDCQRVMADRLRTAAVEHEKSISSHMFCFSFKNDFPTPTSFNCQQFLSKGEVPQSSSLIEALKPTAFQ